MHADLGFKLLVLLNFTNPFLMYLLYDTNGYSLITQVVNSFSSFFLFYFRGMRPENNPKLPFESMPKGTVPSGIDPGVVQKALFKKGATPSAQKPVVFTVKI